MVVIGGQSGGGGQSFTGGFKGFGQEQSEIDRLLSVAIQEGGALGQVAEELVHPERSILSTVGNKFKNAFGGFIDIISVPGQVVAGAISTDYTIGEAIKENVNVSDVLLGDMDPNASAMNKVGNFVVRTGIDILTDPLTYVTFGTGGVLAAGARSSVKIKAGKGLAKELGKELGEDVVLSKKGQELFFKAQQAQRNGARATFLKNERINIVKEAAKAGKKLDEESIIRKLDEIDRATSDKMVNDFMGFDKTTDELLGSEFIKKSMGRLLAKNPALIEDLVDKGGVKFFGKTLISGMRINNTMKLIPGFSLVDEATKPFRNTAMALFDPQRTSTGKLPNEYIALEQKFSNLAESQKNNFLKDATALFRNLNLTKGEADMITHAIEARKIPSDKKLGELWKALHGLEYDTNVIRPEVLTGARFVQKTNKLNIKRAWDAGYKVTEMPNYVPHILVDEPVKQIRPFSTPPTTALAAAKEAKISKFIGQDDGDILIGSAERLGIEKVDGKFIGKEGTEISGKEFERVRATVQEAKDELGIEFDENSVSAIYRATTDNIRATTSNEFVTEVGKKFGVPKSQAPNGYRAISVKGLKDQRTVSLGESIVSEAGEEMYFHPEVANRMETFLGSFVNDEPTSALLRGYDNLQNLWKATVTSIFPSFHGRNALSNVFLNYNDIGMAALNPANHMAAVGILNKERKFQKLSRQLAAGKGNLSKIQDELFDLQNETFLTDKSGYKWTFGELRRVIDENVIAFNNNIVGSIDVTRTNRELIQSVSDELFPETLDVKRKAVQKLKKSTPISQDFVLFKGGRAVGNVIEEQSRILNFLSNLRATGDVSIAAQRTKQFLFDYQNLTPFERNIMKRIIPFYTFTRKNLEAQAKTLLTTPGRINAQITAIGTLGNVLSGGGQELTKEERESLPEWIKDGMFIVNKRKGDQLQVFESLGTPIEAVFGSVQPSSVLGSVSPLLRVPVEGASGYNFFQGKAISEVTNADAFASKLVPDAIRDFIGYTEYEFQLPNGTNIKRSISLRPERMHILQNLPPTSRVLTSLRQMTNQNVSDQYKTLQFLTGLRPFDINLEEQAKRNEKDLQKQIEGLLDDANIGYSFSKFILSDDKKGF